MTIGNGNLCDADDILVGHDSSGGHTFIQRDAQADAGPYTHTGDINWTNVKTFTLGNPAGALLIGFHFQCDFKTSNAAANVSLAVTFRGTSLSDTGLITSHNLLISADLDNREIIARIGEERSGNGVDESIQTNDGGGARFGFSLSPLLALPDASTTVDIDLHTNNASHTATVDDIVMRALWINSYTDI